MAGPASATRFRLLGELDVLRWGYAASGLGRHHLLRGLRGVRRIGRFIIGGLARVIGCRFHRVGRRRLLLVGRGSVDSRFYGLAGRQVRRILLRGGGLSLLNLCASTLGGLMFGASSFGASSFGVSTFGSSTFGVSTLGRIDLRCIDLGRID